MKEIPFLQLLSTAVTTIKVCQVDFYTIGDNVVRDPFHRNDSSRYLPFFFYLFALGDDPQGSKYVAFCKGKYCFYNTR